MGCLYQASRLKLHGSMQKRRWKDSQSQSWWLSLTLRKQCLLFTNELMHTWAHRSDSTHKTHTCSGPTIIPAQRSGSESKILSLTKNYWQVILDDRDKKKLSSMEWLWAYKQHPRQALCPWQFANAKIDLYFLCACSFGDIIFWPFLFCLFFTLFIHWFVRKTERGSWLGG